MEKKKVNFGDNVKFVFPALGNVTCSEKKRKKGPPKDTNKRKRCASARESSRTSGEECDVQDCLES